MNKVARKNLSVNLGDILTINPCQDINYGTKIHVLPFEDTIKALEGDLFTIFLRPYFIDAYRPVKQGI